MVHPEKQEVILDPFSVACRVQTEFVALQRCGTLSQLKVRVDLQLVASSPDLSSCLGRMIFFRASFVALVSVLVGCGGARLKAGAVVKFADEATARDAQEYTDDEADDFEDVGADDSEDSVDEVDQIDTEEHVDDEIDDFEDVGVADFEFSAWRSTALPCGLDEFEDVGTNATFGDAQAFFVARCRTAYDPEVCGAAASLIWEKQD